MANTTPLFPPDATFIELDPKYEGIAHKHLKGIPLATHWLTEHLRNLWNRDVVLLSSTHAFWLETDPENEVTVIRHALRSEPLERRNHV